MKIIHVSDPHLLALRAVPLRQLLWGKRLLGYANILLRRGHQHDFDVAQAVLREVGRCKPDHVVVTGDVSNFGLEAELAAAAQWLRNELGLDHDHVSFVPGNHDAYTRSTHASRSFSRHFGLSPRGPASAVAGANEAFPYCRKLGPVALIGLDSAVPQPPLVAAGHVSETQLQALRRLLDEPGVRDRLPIILVHHPVLYDRPAAKRWLRGLRNAQDLLAAVSGHPRVVFLHGHLHKWVALQLRVGVSDVLSIGAASASQTSRSPDRRAGFNALDVDASGAIQSLCVHTLDVAAGRFEVRDIDVLPYRPRGLW
ncbi:MAG: metallophosphoesterase [Polyangiaceae bacterium]|jgi:3',5'-cyclic AMP phosphodiesterase CpdA|nr:metallophosphoesterase [Polyangiaceae bacterium]